MPNAPRESGNARRHEIPTGAELPEDVRAALIDDVRERLERGELDSDLALVETALALLDGDAQADPRR